MLNKMPYNEFTPQIASPPNPMYQSNLGYPPQVFKMPPPPSMPKTSDAQNNDIDKINLRPSNPFALTEDDESREADS